MITTIEFNIPTYFQPQNWWYTTMPIHCKHIVWTGIRHFSLINSLELMACILKITKVNIMTTIKVGE